MVSTYEHYSTGLGTRFRRGFIFPLLKILLVAFLIYLFLSGLFLTAFQVDSASMRPTLTERDRVLVSPLTYGGRIPFFRDARLPAVRQPSRGDIVVVESPAYVRPSFPLAALEPVVRFLTLQQAGVVRDYTGRAVPRYMIKRVIGVPGDTVRMSQYVAYIKTAAAKDFVPEQALLGDDYSVRTDRLPEGWTEDLPFSGGLDPVTLSADEYFLLGDNRPDSSDSRSWGPVSGRKLLGKAFFRYWPAGRGGKL
jgi:signal peptidase I